MREATIGHATSIAVFKELIEENFGETLKKYQNVRLQLSRLFLLKKVYYLFRMNSSTIESSVNGNGS